MAQRVSLVSRKLEPQSRKEQIEEVFSVRMEDPVDQDIRQWVEKAVGRDVKRISTSEANTRVTGANIVEMSEEEADRLRHELPDALVLRDQRIELIKPKRPTADAKAQVAEPELWHLRAIGLDAARKEGFTGTGKNVTVAVLDTGIDPTHPELDSKVTGAYTFDVNAWEAQPMQPAEDTEGHGTHVAGLICGTNVGVAPDATVLSGVMIPKGFGMLSDFILAIEWAGSQPEVPIVNMSAGIPGYLPEMREEVANLLAVGILPVIATGNEGRNKTRSPGNYIEVLSVGASDANGRVASFSSGGNLIADNHQYSIPDLVAPGKEVYSSVMGGGYEAWDGTSMATPIVSGVAALILEKHPNITVSDLEDVLLSTCKDLGEPEIRQGRGLVQVRGAIT